MPFIISHRPYKLALTLALLLTTLICAPARAQEPIIGEIRLWAGEADAVPLGWLLCDGTGLAPGDYPDLFDLVGFSYGGAIPDVFRVPDLQGRVPVGQKSGDSDFNSLGDVGGEKTHTLTIDEMPAHNHQYVDRSNTLRTDVDYNTTAGAGNGIAAGSGGTTTNRTPFIRNTGGGAAHNNIQPFQVINYIIYTGVGLPTPTPTATPTVTPTGTLTPTLTPTTTPGTPTATPEGSLYLPYVYSQTLSSGHVLTVPLEMSAGQGIISMVLLSVVSAVVLQLVFRVVKQ